MRVVRAADGELEVGRTRPGRGAWLCADDEQCVELAIRRKAFGRALRAPVEPSAMERLRTKVLKSARMEGRAGNRARPQQGRD